VSALRVRTIVDEPLEPGPPGAGAADPTGSDPGAPPRAGSESVPSNARSRLHGLAPGALQDYCSVHE
jgi:hypothetical protein